MGAYFNAPIFVYRLMTVNISDLYTAAVYQAAGLLAALDTLAAPLHRDVHSGPQLACRQQFSPD